MKNLKMILPKLIMFLMSIMFIAPIWMVAVNSIKSKAEANLLGMAFPKDGIIHLINYFKVIEQGGILRSFMNGLIESTFSVVIIVLAASSCAYILARRKGKIYNIIFYTFIMGLIIPVAFIPTYLVLNKLNLVNTYAGLIFIFTTYGLPSAIFLYTGFVKTIPRELDEAALLDGCSCFRAFFSIILPLLKPVTVTISILSFIGAWNDTQIPLFFASGDHWALPLSVYNFYGAHEKSWNLVFADVIIIILPLVIIYMIGQKYIISGMTAGAVKG